MKKLIKRNEKGFTLIELLAVIVILGLLMAIAVPAVSRYLTQSRRKTMVTTIKEYGEAAKSAVYNKELGQLVESETLYYIPVSDNPEDSCVSVEQGGKDPFGDWNKAYVVVAYDEVANKYYYYFTFNDSKGYGLPITEINSLDVNGKAITNPVNKEANSSNIDTQGIVGYKKIVILQTKPSSGERCTVSTAIRKTAREPEPKNGAELIISKSKTTSANAITSGETYKRSQPATQQTGAQVEYRFLGTNANNYFKFNGQTWRVIGVFGKKIKLIKQDPVAKSGTCMAYDDAGNNDWSKSSLKTWLNGSFYNSISEGQRKYIIKERYYLGGLPTSNYSQWDSNKLYVDDFYTGERSTNGYGSNAKYWDGYVALPYASDIVYGSGGGYFTYEECLGKTQDTFGNGSCATTNWFKKTDYFYALNPNSDNGQGALVIGPEGSINSLWRAGGVTNCHQVYPVITLDGNTQIKGTGKSSDPYIIK